MQTKEETNTTALQSFYAKCVRDGVAKKQTYSKVFARKLWKYLLEQGASVTDLGVLSLKNVDYNFEPNGKIVEFKVTDRVCV